MMSELLMFNSVQGGWNEVTVWRLPADSHGVLGTKTHAALKTTAPPAARIKEENTSLQNIILRHKELLVS